MSEKGSCGDKQVKKKQGSNIGGAVEGQPGIWGVLGGREGSDCSPYLGALSFILLSTLASDLASLSPQS